jgi:V/A-type H+-transporting ATPase subunit A
VRTLRQGSVARISGPLIEVTGIPDLAMLEVVEIGRHRISSETISISEDRATLQAYEYTGGLRVGDPAVATGHQLAGLLGPGLLGHVFDGLLRPLSSRGMWLTPDTDSSTAGAIVPDSGWRFEPAVRVGAMVEPGQILGTVPEAGAVEHRVLVPNGVSGVVTWLLDPKEVHPLDAVARIGERAVSLAERWPVRRARPFLDRITEAIPLQTGQRALDLLYPLAKGSAAAVPGGFGTGKTLLLQQIAKWSDADVIVYVGCGERGNEMADVLDGLSSMADARTAGRLIDRTVIIANTSNMPMMAREASIYTGVTVAEYFRDMGYDVVVIADSTSRWAEALREFGNRNGDLPAEEGYPANLASRLAAFYERAGRVSTLGGRAASVTIIGAISPAGGDMTEPVTTDTERFVRTLWPLDRDLAYSRHYPAVSWAGAFARDADPIGAWYAGHDEPDWATRRAQTIALLSESDRLASLAEIVGANSLPGRERMLLLGGRLIRDGVLMQSALSRNDASCSAAKGGALVDLVLKVLDMCQALIRRGVPAEAIEQADFGAVLRAKDEVGSADAEGVRERVAGVLAQLEALT